jgi:hypothetical protein
MNKVAKLSQARGARGARGWPASGLSGETSVSLQRDAQEVMKEAYDVVRGVDSLDTSKDGIDAWLSAMEQYSDRVDKVETQMAANLPNSLLLYLISTLKKILNTLLSITFLTIYYFT